jgi:hypothetical protein
MLATASISSDAGTHRAKVPKDVVAGDSAGAADSQAEDPVEASQVEVEEASQVVGAAASAAVAANFRDFYIVYVGKF